MSFPVVLKKILKILTLVCLFVAYDVFVIRTPHAFFEDIFGKRFYINYSISILALLVFILLLDFLFKRKLFSKIIASLLIIIPLGIQTAHYKLYNMPLSSFGIRTFLDEPLILTELGFENINVMKICFYALFCAFIIFIFLYHPDTSPRSRKHNFKFPLYSVAFSTIIYFCGTNWFLILDYQNSMASVYAAVPETARSFYYKKVKVHKEPIVLPPTEKKLPNVLWIIGESVVKDYMGIYGYEEDTTPGLLALQKSGELIAFKNVISIGSYTIVSVPYMLVGLQRNDPEGQVYSAPNIFEYAKARNYQTAFISAQDLRWRNFDQFIGDRSGVDFFRSGPDFSTDVNVSKGADDFKVLNESILPHLETMKSPFLLVVQMDGSHYPYQAHSPKEYKKFLPEETPNSINAYKNTLVYSDIYLTRLIETAREKDPAIWIFYSTDHGQNIKINESNSFFNQGYQKNVVENAFFIVPPKKMRNNLVQQINDPAAQSDIFATILDLMDIQAPVHAIDGLSLLHSIPQNRLRLTTSFVKTNKNTPSATVIYPDGSSASLDFVRKNVTFGNENKVVAFDDAPEEIKDFLR